MIYSAVQPTGRLHLGNYIGAIQHWIKLQYYPSSRIYALADMHALTGTRQELYKDNLSMTAELLACGIDPKKSILMRNSKNPYHTQLAWILTCIAPLGRLELMTQYKTKKTSAGHIEFTPAGLLMYPVLQASDILLYKSTMVPVGPDQHQHLELTRELATRFNRQYKSSFFPIPSALDTNDMRIMSLQDGTKKMSKSDPNSLGRIHMIDDADEIKRKVHQALTDSNPQLGYDPQNRPNVFNLINIYKCCCPDMTIDQIVQKYNSFTSPYTKLKQDLTELLIDICDPIRTEYSNWMNNLNQVESILCDGEEQAMKIACENYQEISKHIGLA